MSLRSTARQLAAAFFICGSGAAAGCAPASYQSLPEGVEQRITVEAPKDWQSYKAGEEVRLDYRFYPKEPGDLVHLYVDDLLVRILREPVGSYTMAELEPGSHLFKLSLRDDLHRSRGDTASVAVRIGGGAAQSPPSESPGKQKREAPQAGAQAAGTPAAGSHPAKRAADTAASSAPRSGKDPARSGAAAPAQVKIFSPQSGATVSPNTPWEVRYSFVPLLEGDHLHVLLNGQLINMIREPSGTISLAGLPPGNHTLVLEMNDASHQPIGIQESLKIAAADRAAASETGRRAALRRKVGGDIPVEQREAVRDPGVSPAVSQQLGLLSPADRAAVPGGKPVIVRYRFTPLLPGDHLHLYVDNVLNTMLREPTGEHQVEGLLPGKHEIRLELNDGQHQPVGINRSVIVEVQP